MIADVVLRTPLIRLQVPESPAEIWLKLECLQPIGSFKIRGAANAIRSAPAGAVDRGVLTTSAGNMAQGVAWMARELGVPATVVAPEHAPQTKLDAIARLGGTVIKVPYERWWQTMEEGAYPGVDGYFVHPVLDDAVMAGNGTIGLELVEDLDEIDTVLDPVGRRRPVDRDRERARIGEPRDARARLRARDGRPVRRVVCERRPRSRSTTPRRSSTARVASCCSARCGIAPTALLSGGFALTLDETAAAVRPWPSAPA